MRSNSKISLQKSSTRQTLPSNHVLVENKGSGLCVKADFLGSGTNFPWLYQVNCDNVTRGMLWRVFQSGGVKFENKDFPGGTWDVFGASRNDGEKILYYNFHSGGGDAQGNTVSATNFPGYWMVKNNNSGLCFSMDNSNSGTQMTQRGCNPGDPKQAWGWRDPNEVNISGVIKDQNGNPIPGSTVCTFTGNGQTFTATANNGNFSLKLPKGSYTRVCKHDGYEDLNDNLNINSNNQNTDGTMNESQVNISGVIKDQNGNPIPGSTVCTFSGGGKTFTATANNGSFSIQLPKGSYTRVCKHDGYDDLSDNLDINSNNQNADGTMNQQVQNLTVRGYVVNAASNQNIPQSTLTAGNIEISFIDSTGKIYQATVTNGVYEVELPPGKYQRVATLNGWITAQDDVEITRSLTEEERETSILMSQIVKGYRLVLTWTGTQSDLDLQIYGNGDRVSWKKRSSNDGKAVLDVDDRNGFGPETITIKEETGNTNVWKAYVNNYSGESPMNTSGAIVKLYHGDKLEKEYKISAATGNPSAWWYICDIDIPNAKVTDRNSYL